MFDFHEKRKIRSIVYSKPVVAVLVIITVVLSFSVYHRYTVAEEMKHKLNVREDELHELEQRATVLESKVQYLRDERGIEEELRNRFDVVKEGEQVIILVDEPQGGEGKREILPLEGKAPHAEDDSFLETFKFW